MRSFAEPDEIETPLNSDLDRLEDLVSAIIEQGGEAPLRARLGRLLGGTDQPDGEQDRDECKALGMAPSAGGATGHQGGNDLAPAVRLFSALYAKSGNGALAFEDTWPGAVPDATTRSERARVLLRRPAVAALVAALGGDPGPKPPRSRRRDQVLDAVDVDGTDLERIARIIAAAAGTLPLRVTIEVAPEGRLP